MYSVHFVGIIYFHVCTTDRKIALVPNGINGDGHVPPHYASFFIEASLHDSDTWWRDQKFNRQLQMETALAKPGTFDVLEFRIPKPAVITFDCGDETLETKDLDIGLPQLKKIDPRFVLDLNDVDTIAQMAIPGGKLQAFQFGGDASVVSWTITKHSDLVTITASAGDEIKRITLKRFDRHASPEIVFSNTPDLITARSEPPGHTEIDHPGHKETGSGTTPSNHAGGHFTLYAKLDKNRDERGLENPTLPNVRVLDEWPFEHRYLLFLLQKEQIPMPGCVPTCCGS